MAYINNMKDLKQVVAAFFQLAMEFTQEEIFKIIQDKVDEYYSEPVFDNKSDPSRPKVYRRTGELDRALEKSDIINNNGQFSFTVGFADDYLTFRYPGNPEWGERNEPATGADVLHWFNNELHGGVVKGEHRYWDEALEEIKFRGGVTGIFKKHLKSCGVPIK